MNKKKRIITVSTVIVIVVLILILLAVKNFFADPVKDAGESLISTKTTEAGEPYKSPIDLEKLQKKYPDIIAWIDIPNTPVSYPIFQNKDDTKYLRHDRDGKYSIGGEIFTEYAYNKADFSDPVTMIYGHNMHNSTIFGPLQQLFADVETTAKNKEIILYLSDREYHYSVFGATTFDDRHILYNYDFTEKRIYDAFFEYIEGVRSLDTFFDEETFASGIEDKVIFLSTCKNGDTSKRFLVMAVLTEVIK